MSMRTSLAVALTLILSGALIALAVAAMAMAEPVSNLVRLVFAAILLNALLVVPALAWQIAPYLSASLRKQLETKRRLQASGPHRTIPLPQ